MLKNNDVGDNSIQFEILNILGNFGYVLLVIIHNDKVIDLFHSKFSSFLVTIINLCKSDIEYLVDLEISYNKIFYMGKLNFLINSLYDLFDITVKRGIH